MLLIAQEACVEIDPGTIIDDKYQIDCFIGAGGMGAIYRAQQKQLDRTVAVKLVDTTIADESGVARFEREARAISSLHHRHIVQFYGYGIWHSHPYMVMEFIEGTSLEALLEKKGHLPPKEAIEIVTQVCEALQCAHANGVIHRDLKPSNIMLAAMPDGRHSVKIIDFGLAKMAATSDRHLQNITSDGQTVGSVLYMSPEQCIAEKVDQRSDIYSLGCILYHCLSGLPPFRDDRSVVIMCNHVERDAPNLRALDENSLPEGLQEVVDKMMAKLPEDRYTVIDEVLEDLEKVSSGATDKLLARKSVPRRSALALKLKRRNEEQKISLPLLTLLIICLLVPFLICVVPPHQRQTRTEENSLSMLRAAEDVIAASPDDKKFDAGVIKNLSGSLAADKADHLLGGKRIRVYAQLTFSEVRQQQYQAAFDDGIKAMQMISTDRLPINADAVLIVQRLVESADRIGKGEEGTAFGEKFLQEHLKMEKDHLDGETIGDLKMALASIYLGRGQTQKALRMVLSILPHRNSLPFTEARARSMALCYLSNGEPTKSLPFAKRAVELGGLGGCFGDLSLLVALSYFQQDNWNDGESWLKKFLEQRPLAAEACGAICLSEAHKGNWQKAHDYYEVMIRDADADKPYGKIAFANRPVVLQYARLLKSNGQEDAAKAVLQKLQQLDSLVRNQ